MFTSFVKSLIQFARGRKQNRRNSPSNLANKEGQPITNSNRKFLCSFESGNIYPTTYQKSRRIEVQEDTKNFVINALTPKLNMKTRL